MNIALILAAGCGRRMGADMPKQFVELLEKPILAYTLEAFQHHPEIDGIYTVCPADRMEEVWEIGNTYGISRLQAVIPGGKTRRESSYLGIEALGSVCDEEDIVLIHDGVRPNVGEKTIGKNILLARTFGACETAVETSDTIAVSPDGIWVESVPPRRMLWNVQTPQSFQYGIIREAHEFYAAALARGEAELPEITDDAGLILYMEEQLREGRRVHICPGEPGNLKVTKPEDLRILLSILQKGNGGS